MEYSLFTEEVDLLDISEFASEFIDEAFAEQRTIVKAIANAIRLFRQTANSEEKYKMFTKIRFDPQLRDDKYAYFVTGRSMSLSIAEYDIERLRYDDDTDEDRLHDVNDLLQDLINEVNREMKGFRLRIDKGPDLLGEILICRR